MAIKVLYIIFLALLLVLFVWWFLASFYPTPTWESEYPGEEQYKTYVDKPSDYQLQQMSAAERNAAIKQYEAKQKEFKTWEAKRKNLQERLDKKVERHGRNVAIISLVMALVLMGLGVGLSTVLPAISEGLLLGGVFTLMSSMGWSFVRTPKLAVVVVGVGLIVTLVLGYKRFVKPARAPAE